MIFTKKKSKQRFENRRFQSLKFETQFQNSTVALQEYFKMC
jgi:hypothetical protein